MLLGLSQPPKRKPSSFVAELALFSFSMLRQFATLPSMTSTKASSDKDTRPACLDLPDAICIEPATESFGSQQFDQQW